MSLFQSKEFDLIVGISCYGMIASYMIALNLNKNCCDIESYVNNNALKSGISRSPKETLKYPKDALNILFVDDYIDDGKHLAESTKLISNINPIQITTLCVYSSKKNRSDVDIILEYLPGLTSFEWNIFHQKFTRSSCFDIDGVLCVDPSGEQDDDSVKYKEFLLNVNPLFKPLGKINYLVTSRLEKYRPETEAWLKQHDIEYGALIMLDLPSKEERLKKNMNAIHKAEAFKNSEQDIFYESSRNEAVKIHNLTLKPVYCVETNEMFSRERPIPEINYKSKYSNKTLFILKRIPKPFYNKLRTVYRFFVY